MTADKKWTFKMLPSILRSFPFPLHRPSNEAAMSWRAPARAVACLWSWLPSVEGLLVPAVSLLEGLPLAPRGRGGRCFHGNLYLNRLGSQT